MTGKTSKRANALAVASRGLGVPVKKVYRSGPLILVVTDQGTARMTTVQLGTQKAAAAVMLADTGAVVPRADASNWQLVIDAVGVLSQDVGPDEARDILVELLGGLDVAKLEQIGTDVVGYTLHLTDGRLVHMDPADPPSATRFARAVFQYTAHAVPGYKQEVWPNVLHFLTPLVVVVAADEGSTLVGEALGWVRDYLGDPPRNFVGHQDSGWPVTDNPYRHEDGHWYFQLPQLADWMTRMRRGTPDRRLGTRLKAAGATGAHQVRTKGGTRVAAWKIPHAIVYPEVGPQ